MKITAIEILPASKYLFIKVKTDEGLEGVGEGIWCETKEGEKVLVPGKTVICALGQRPNYKTVDELLDCAPFVRVIGDANSVGTITKATYQGHHAALDI